MNTFAVQAGPDRPHKWRPGALLIILGALLALGVTSWRYFDPLSGVSGSGGALLTMFGEFALVAAGLILAFSHHRALRGVFVSLAWPGVILTFIAALFLHGWAAALFLLVCAAGVMFETFFPYKKRIA